MDTTTLTVGDTLPNHLTILSLEPATATAAYTYKTMFDRDELLVVQYWAVTYPPSGCPARSRRAVFRQPVGTPFVHELKDDDPERAIAEQLIAAQLGRS